MALRLEVFDNYHYKLYAGNHVVGTIELQVEGTYLYFPDPQVGGYSEHSLRDVAEIIEDLNKPFYDHVKKYFEEE